MKALRVILSQSSANYRREETVENKMTYPLPPLSTVIGALHNACGYREYQAMDISIQGMYGSMHREPYTDYCFLNSLQDDRGTLVKMRNGALLSNAFEKVASAKKPQGNSFRKNVTIQIHNAELLKEYQDLKEMNDKIAEFKKGRMAKVLQLIKVRKQRLSDKKNKAQKGSEEYMGLSKREAEMKEAEKALKKGVEEYQAEQYSKPILRYRSLTTSMKFYEILNQVQLVLHIRTEDAVLSELLEHIYELKSIGRSEDMVHVEEAKIVDVTQQWNEEVTSSYAAYIDYQTLKDRQIFLEHTKVGIAGSGTKYYMNKNYEIIDGKRRFAKKKVVYVSQYGTRNFRENVYYDPEKGYIVNFL